MVDCSDNSGTTQPETQAPYGVAMGLRWPGRPFDLGLACVVAGLGVVEALVPLSTVMGDGSPTLAAGFAALTGLVLVTRRTRPLFTLVLVMLPWSLAALAVPILVLFWGGLVPMAVAVYSVSRHGRGRTPMLGAGLAASLLLLFTIGSGMAERPGELFFPWLALVMAWLLGWIIHRKEAGAASQVVEVDPAYVRRSLDGIRQIGSEALDQMRLVVTLLRESDEDQPRDPQPGLADLAALVERSETENTRVRLEVDGEPRPIPAGADLAVYRIVQEALTNVHRHASATDVQVTVSYGAAAVGVEICDNGASRFVATPGVRGHGLVGMRERATLYGGQLHAGPRPEGGFRVRARLPVEAAS